MSLTLSRPNRVYVMASSRRSYCSLWVQPGDLATQMRFASWQVQKRKAQAASMERFTFGTRAFERSPAEALRPCQ